MYNPIRTENKSSARIVRGMVHAGVPQPEEGTPRTTYKVRVYKVGAMGFLTKADHYEDFRLESAAGLEEFAKGLAITGFRHPEEEARWIMPSAIVWVEVA